MSHSASRLVRAESLRILAGNRSLLEPLKGTEVVVLGGTGFLGTWILELLMALNDEFGFGIRSLVVSRSTDQFVSRFPHIAKRDDIRFEKCDVRQLWQLPMDADWVIHAAATPDTRVHASKPLEVASVVAEGAMSIVRAAERMSRLRMLMFLSSGLVAAHDKESDKNIDEMASMAPPPESSFMYAGAKRFAETVFSAARSQCRIPTVVVRPFSLLGPYQPLDRPFAHTSFIADGLKGDAIRVQGDGSTIRSYMYGADAAFWMLRMMVGGKSGDVFNVGSDEAIDLRTMALKVAAGFQSRPEVLFNTGIRSVRTDRLVPSIAKAQDRLKLSPMTPLDMAISKTIEWNRLMKASV